MKNYWQPTPVMARKIGDALLLVSTTITTTQIYQGNENAAVIALWIGVVGKVITNLFGEPNSGNV